MNKTTSDLLIPDEIILNKIYFIRGQKVMLDEDLAKLYGVETRRLNEQVKRNAGRFPHDFMFQLSSDEYNCLMSQFAISNDQKTKTRRGGRRKLPYVFTEHGVLMLSSVLNNERAINVNIRIMRLYIKLREILITNKDILLKLEQLEKQTGNNTNDIAMIFKVLKQLVTPIKTTRESIGFKLPAKRKKT